MCISAGRYHQGWENPNFSEMMHWILCFNEKKNPKKPKKNRILLDLR
jgi:hypothetical protein